MIAGIVIAVIAAIVVIWAIAAYNGLVGQRNKVEEAFSTMDVYMKKRYDLIPQRGRIGEGLCRPREVDARRAREGPQRGRRGRRPCRALRKRKRAHGRLCASSSPWPKATPTSKANQNPRPEGQLQRVEEDIANARKYYNGSVREYNNKVQMFPLVDHRGDVPLRAQAHVRSDERGRTRERAGVVLACSGGPGARRRFDCAGGKRLPAARARGGAERLPHDAAPAPQPARGRGFPWTLVCAPSAGGRAPSRWRWRRSRSPARPRPSPIRATRTTRASQSIPTTWRLPCMPTTPSPSPKRSRSIFTCRSTGSTATSPRSSTWVRASRAHRANRTRTRRG